MLIPCVRPLAGTLHIEIMMAFSRHYMAQESDMGIKGQTCSVLGNCAYCSQLQLQEQRTGSRIYSHQLGFSLEDSFAFQCCQCGP
ncbi:hypothetical protein XENTR_v10010570 [Xenopus tropicalis]|nr:hypothetical protein XENTR_v10010570 [Xenopus tropicalis]